MYSKTSITTLLTCSVLLTACGGGGSSSDSIGGVSVTNTAPELKLITGVYNTSRSDDESYLYIEEDGDVDVYDYQNDDQGSGLNCYSKTTSISQINHHFNSKKVTYSGSDKLYTLEGDGATLVFGFDTKTGLTNMKLNNTFSTDTGFNIKASNLNIRIGGGGSLNLPSTRIQITDITAALCK